MAVGWNRVHW